MPITYIKTQCWFSVQSVYLCVFARLLSTHTVRNLVFFLTELGIFADIFNQPSWPKSILPRHYPHDGCGPRYHLGLRFP